jgi:hypothetical protein
VLKKSCRTPPRAMQRKDHRELVGKNLSGNLAQRGPQEKAGGKCVN